MIFEKQDSFFTWSPFNYEGFLHRKEGYEWGQFKCKSDFALTLFVVNLLSEMAIRGVHTLLVQN